MDDGVFETLIIQNPENANQVTDIVASLVLNTTSKYIHRIKSSDIEFRFEEPVQWVLDGEYGGEQTHVYIKNHQKTINFIKKS